MTTEFPRYDGKKVVPTTTSGDTTTPKGTGSGEVEVKPCPVGADHHIFVYSFGQSGMRSYEETHGVQCLTCVETKISINEWNDAHNERAALLSERDTLREENEDLREIKDDLTKTFGPLAADLESMQKENATLLKELEERGYAFQEAQNKTLLENETLRHQVETERKGRLIEDRLKFEAVAELDEVAADNATLRKAVGELREAAEKYRESIRVKSDGMEPMNPIAGVLDRVIYSTRDLDTEGFQKSKEEK